MERLLGLWLRKIDYAGIGRKLSRKAEIQLYQAKRRRFISRKLTYGVSQQKMELGYEPEGREFESLRAHHLFKAINTRL